MQVKLPSILGHLYPQHLSQARGARARTDTRSPNLIWPGLAMRVAQSDAPLWAQVHDRTFFYPLWDKIDHMSAPPARPRARTARAASETPPRGGRFAGHGDAFTENIGPARTLHRCAVARRPAATAPELFSPRRAVGAQRHLHSLRAACRDCRE